MSESVPASPTEVSPPATEGRARGPWLWHPVVDILVGCGLLALPLAVAAHYLSLEAGSAVVVAFGALAVIVNGPHYAATIVRAARQPGRTHAVLLVASMVAVVVVIAAHLQPILLAVLFTAYLTWSPWHYATQNHGISLLLLVRSGTVTATTSERRLLRGVHVVLALSAMAAVQAGPSEPFLWRLGLNVDVVRVVTGIAVAVALLLLALVVRRLRQRGMDGRTTAAVVTLASTSLVWFAVPMLLRTGGGLVYAGGAAALMHCGQYLWVTSFAEGRTAYVEKRRFDGIAWAAVVVALGIALFTVVPWGVSRLGHYDLIFSLLIFQAVVNLHHYVVDAFTWKMRDPAVRIPLVEGRQMGAARREEVSNLKAIGATVVVVALVVVAAVDVLQLAATRSDASDDARLRALTINEYDSRLWVQEAQLAVANSDLDGALADLGRAVSLSPYNADAQRALLRLHVASDHLEEAWARRDAAPKGVFTDPASLSILADVALRLEHYDDAAALAADAIKTVGDTRNGVGIEARRILGTVHFVKGELGEARVQLQGAFDDVEALAGPGDFVRKGNALELSLTLADTLVGLHQHDPAMVLFDRALEGAGNADRPDVAFRALTGRAAVAIDKDQAPMALDHLQRALRIAEALKDDPRLDPERISRTWLDYGGLLAKSDAPMTSRYACALRARNVAEDMEDGDDKDELLRFITEATRFVEEVLTPEEQESVRTDVGAAAVNALSLSYPETPPPPPATPPPPVPAMAP